MAGLALKIGPWVALVIMTGLYLGKRDDLATEIERCNTDKMTSIAEAERITRDATTRALEARISQIESMALDAQKARDIAIQARIEAESRPVKTVEVIRRIRSENSCLDTPVPAELVDTLRLRSD